MLGTAMFLFLLAGLSGIVLATMAFSDKKMPILLTIGHGLFAVGGLGLFIYVVTTMAGTALGYMGMILLILVALGGLILLSFHISGKQLPMPLVFIHGIGAVFGIVLAFVYLLMQNAP